MSFSQWFQENEGTVNAVGGMLNSGGSQQPVASAAGMAPTAFQQDPIRQNQDDGGNSKLMQIVGLVSSIYTGGATAAAGAASSAAAKK